MDIAKRVDQYVRLRDKIKELDDAHKDKLKPYRDALEGLNVQLLQYLAEVNTDSASTEFGTVYKTAKTSASLADPEAFRRYIIANQAWDMVDLKANVTAVKEHIAEHNELPPGVNYNQVYVVGVRRK